MENNTAKDSKCMCDNPPEKKICSTPFYDAFSLCLICSHTLACHIDSEAVAVATEGEVSL